MTPCISRSLTVMVQFKQQALRRSTAGVLGAETPARYVNRAEVPFSIGNAKLPFGNQMI